MKKIKDNILKSYNFRFACKEFDTAKKISPEDFDFILQTGRLSPSSFGFEPWKFLVIQDTNIRMKLKEFAWGAKRQLPSSSHFIILLARKAVDTTAGSQYTIDMMKNIQKLPEDIIEMKSNFYKNFQKNDFDLTDDRKLFDWASKQLYIPLANMMSSAALIGIDSCPIEGFDREKIDEILLNEGIIDTRIFSTSVMVAFGYRIQAAPVPPKTRRSIDDVVQWI